MNRWWKIRLTPRSPFLIAAKRITANDYETLDYIPARVLKAAVARAIIESYGGTPEDGTPPRYWVDPGLDPARCRPEWREWIKPFSEILFSDAMPYGAGRPPSTLLVCKVDPSHSPQDDLINRYALRKAVAAPGQLPPTVESGDAGEGRRCKECPQRLERWKSGWRLPSGGRQPGKVAHVQKRVFTRVELDVWRHTHRDEHLFSVAVGIPEALVGNTAEPLVFEGWIHAPEDVDLTLPPGFELRVGANLGTGLGRMEVEVFPEPPEDRKRWAEFGDWKKEVHDPSSVALVLVTDALYGVGGKRPVASLEENLAEYARWWQSRPSAIPAPSSLTVSYASIQYESRYPFVAGQPGIRTVDPLWYWLGGSLFVFSVTDPAEEEVLLQWATAVVKCGVRSDVSVQGAPAWSQDESPALSGSETTWTPVRAWSAGKL
ncbi:hypothetical protein [Kyrpidia spormannii]|uniref:Uncharacterized protein n=1 Tax=Kyrpidia spormannii TaxID=2055160 RepID=A0ACA8ZBL8_9BACL|nr:hypothetical protein [Kyrpidia spormannii]CAB3394558.1 conserved protein of unknown function [Kyrpidia spormannii]